MLAKSIYQLTRAPDLARDFALSSQLQRAAVSIMSNIAEGYERDGPTEFRRYLTIAKASCAEVRSLLYVCLDTGYLPREDFEPLLRQAEEVARVIGGLRKSIRN